MATKSKAGVVLVRTYSAGVHYGQFVSRDGQEVTLTGARRIWSWRGANTLNEIARRGVGAGSKISEATPGEIVLLQAIEIIDVAPEAVASLGSILWIS